MEKEWGAVLINEEIFKAFIKEGKAGGQKKTWEAFWGDKKAAKGV